MIIVGGNQERICQSWTGAHTTLTVTLSFVGLQLKVCNQVRSRYPSTEMDFATRL